MKKRSGLSLANVAIAVGIIEICEQIMQNQINEALEDVPMIQFQKARGKKHGRGKNRAHE